MSPTIVLDAAGKPVLSIGAAGGPTIISQVLVGLLAGLDQGLPPSEALASPRVHHQWRPDRVLLEEAAGSKLVEQLQSLGHEVVMVDSFGAAQMIGRGRGGSLAAASDPRIPGLAGSFAPGPAADPEPAAVESR
jgi:gamma-glutamyltranspeptidase/glutathione hydrolase